MFDCGSTVTAEMLATLPDEIDLFGRALFTIPGVADGITTEEIQRIHGAGKGIVLFDNAITQASLDAGFAGGQSDANKALAKLRELGAPVELYCFGDLEYGERIPVAYLNGRANTWRGSEFNGAGGLYAALGATYFLNPFMQAYNQNSNVQRFVLWAAQPAVKGDSPWPTTFAPSNPTPCACLIHQFAEGAHGGVYDLDVTTDDAPAWAWMPSEADAKALIAKAEGELQQAEGLL